MTDISKQSSTHPRLLCFEELDIYTTLEINFKDSLKKIRIKELQTTNHTALTQYKVKQKCVVSMTEV